MPKGAAVTPLAREVLGPQASPPQQLRFSERLGLRGLAEDEHSNCVGHMGAKGRAQAAQTCALSTAPHPGHVQGVHASSLPAQRRCHPLRQQALNPGNESHGMRAGGAPVELKSRDGVHGNPSWAAGAGAAHQAHGIGPAAVPVVAGSWIWA